MIPYSVPISIKGIVFDNGKVWLRKNERNEWELPGGKLNPGEQPEQTVIREVQEELGFTIEVIDVIQSYLYTVKSSNDESHGVLVVSYLCKLINKVGEFELNSESGKVQFHSFPPREVPELKMPEFYKIGIEKAWKYLRINTPLKRHNDKDYVSPHRHRRSAKRRNFNPLQHS